MPLESWTATKANLDRRGDHTKPNEDAHVADNEAGVFAVADGVSSYWPEGQPYSGSARGGPAARTLVTAVHEFILSQEPDGLNDMEHLLRLAFRSANIRIGSMHSHPDRTDHLYGYPGAVATVVMIRDSRASWVHLGDTILLHLPATGGADPLTRNQIESFTGWRERCRGQYPFDVRGAEAHIRVARDIRNKSGHAESFGVLTGEPDALHFVETGSLLLAPGDHLVLLTDGFQHLWKAQGINPYRTRGVQGLPVAQWEFLHFLRSHALCEFIESAEKADTLEGARSDDKTVVVVQNK